MKIVASKGSHKLFGNTKTEENIQKNNSTAV